MTRFKFRAWMKTSEVQWVVLRSIRIGLNGKIYDDEGFDRLMNIVVEQFTGLLDKNGVEIYEGDILEHKFFDGLGDEETSRVYAVEWRRDSDCRVSGVGLFFGGNGRPAHPEGEDLVIGNIHQNPELL